MSKELTPIDKTKALIKSDPFTSALSRVIPRDGNLELLKRQFVAAINNNPKLAECTWPSLSNCMLDCAALGLMPDRRLAHLIPYGRECTLVVDYKGLIEMVTRSGKVSFIDAYCVYSNELDHDPQLGRPRFVMTAGTNPNIQHDPIFIGERGEFVGVYAVAQIKGEDRAKFSFLSKAEVDKVRKSSKASGKGPWVDWFDEMAKKTAIRRLSKFLPLSAEWRDYEERIDRHEPVDNPLSHGAIDTDARVETPEQEAVTEAAADELFEPGDQQD